MAAQKTATKKNTVKKATAKKATAKKAPAKKATAKKATAKKAPAKKASTKKSKTSAKKVLAKKAPAKKASTKKSKTSAKKAPAKKASTRTSQASKKQKATAHGAASSVLTHPPLTPKKSLSISALAVSYRDGDALAHPVTAEQMEEVAHDGLRGDQTILHVEDDAEVAPCRLVDHGEGRYSLCLDDFRMPQPALFDERGLQGGGYTWEALADSLARLRRPELVDGLSYDSEASMFVALGTRPTLVALAHLLHEAMDDEALLRAAVDAADPDRLE